jgi:8-oxo-dGTP pyrophosphatase MutT (NUDIX family)
VDDCEDSRAGAAREVEEETGWYLARWADLVGEPVADETAEVRSVPLDETPEMIARGDILGAVTIIGVQHALLQRST